MNLESADWELVGDVTRSKEAQGFTFFRDPNQKSTVGDIGGAVWFKKSRNNISGLKISFIPSITVDLNYYGNVKYPQGFAFVFTSNPTSKLIGDKRSGLGYDGIQDAVAFEWDFIQNSDKNDVREPHFSAHYNLGGEISSRSPKDCQKLCNVKVANFYDVQKEAFQKDVEYTIEIYGGRLSVYENGVPIVSKVNFPYLDKLMEDDEVYMGITASMNLHKAVDIKNLKVYKSKYFFF
jgi:hypothetical protein